MTDVYEAMDQGIEASEGEIAKVLRAVADEIDSDTIPNRNRWIRALVWCLKSMRAAKETEPWPIPGMTIEGPWNSLGLTDLDPVSLMRCTCHKKITAECPAHPLRR